MMLPIAQIVPSTDAEGPGKRFAIWLQGCPLRCPGCCNPEMLPFRGGTPTSMEQLVSQITDHADSDGIEGVTLLGGEPFAHAKVTAPLAAKVQQLGLTVMIFSGYTYEQLQNQCDPEVDRLLAATDILVDGPYIKEQPDPDRRWIGSANQQIHFLTDRYTDDDARWDKPDTLEIRLEKGQISVNGFPAVGAKGLWKRPTRPRRNQRGR